ncbi:MFS general substrate transporter [Microthyrium microscopicum]|uniref:MFS general substrate transporter n=1 Tax=Microthyrium microscopicum TaxID=703497 RepID=A0A6A6TX89_9PEZI|nr:MFS general substrate transporter [Microthyrium microscopicum]
MSTVLTYSGRSRVPSSNPSSEELDDKKKPIVRTGSVESIPSLGQPKDEKRFWWQRAKGFDGDAIATQPSVFDDPESSKEYQPRSDWENLHRFNPLARWTWNEEYKLIRKIDFKIMFFACIMFMALELDRANIQQANTDNFLPDLKLTTNDYNLGNTVFKLAFLCAELPSQLVSKWAGPDRWIPTQLVLWSIVASSQFWLTGRTTFLLTRALLGILQGGFIPDIVLYLSYFYKHHELSLRLSFFWTAMSFADIFAGFLAYGLLHLRGLHGLSGWRWMFLIEGLMTLMIGVAAFVLMPAGPCQTANWSRGKKGWFTAREEEIIVNRVIRDDPSKGTMHNRQPITPKLLFKSLRDFDLWPLYILGLTFQIPMTPVSQYLTLSLKGLGFDTFQSNLLAIPNTAIHIVTMLILSYLSEMNKELTLHAMVGQIWALPFLIYLTLIDVKKVSKWTVWAVITVLLGYPNAHPIQVGWNSRNSNTVRSRTVSAAAYNMFVQAGGIIASNVYQKSDAPNYRHGNRALIGICCGNIVLYVLTKVYYTWRNKQREAKWSALSEQEKINYLATTEDEGSFRLDFRFAN